MVQVQPPFEDLADKAFESPGRWAPVLGWLLHKHPHACTPHQLAAWSRLLAAWLKGASASLAVPDEAAMAARVWMARLCTAITRAYSQLRGQSSTELQAGQVGLVTGHTAACRLQAAGRVLLVQQLQPSCQ